MGCSSSHFCTAASTRTGQFRFGLHNPKAVPKTSIHHESPTPGTQYLELSLEVFLVALACIKTRSFPAGFGLWVHFFCFVLTVLSQPNLLFWPQFSPQLSAIPGPAACRPTPCPARESAELAPTGNPGRHISQADQ